MMDCNFQEISILNMLLNHPFVEPEAMMLAFDISLRTVQLEIRILNTKLRKEDHDGLQIRNQRGKGYYLSCPDTKQEWVKELARQCYDYLSQRMNSLPGKHERVSHIIRILLRAGECVKAEYLAELLNVSQATLNKDMRMVRRYLAAYGLAIQSVPHHGMKVFGKELAVRSCMIDFCDIYSAASEPIFVQNCLEEFQITGSRLEENRKKCRNVLKKYGYIVTDSSFNRLVLYLTVLPLRLNHDSDETVNVPVLNQLMEYQMAADLLGSGCKEQEYCFQAVFLMGCADSFNDTAGESIRRLIQDDEGIAQAVLGRLQQKIWLDLSGHQDIIAMLKQFICKWRLKKEWSLFELNRSDKITKTVNKMPSSCALAVYFLSELPGTEAVDYQDMLFYELILCFYSSSFRIKNEYLPTNIILVNELGKQTNPLVKSRLGISDYNVVFHEYYLYELDELDFSRYDYLLISQDTSFDAESLPIPVYRYEFYMRRGQNVWHQLVAKKRKVGAIGEYFAHPVHNVKNTT